MDFRKMLIWAVIAICLLMLLIIGSRSALIRLNFQLFETDAVEAADTAGVFGLQA